MKRHGGERSKDRRSTRPENVESDNSMRLHQHREKAEGEIA